MQQFQLEQNYLLCFRIDRCDFGPSVAKFASKYTFKGLESVFRSDYLDNDQFRQVFLQMLKMFLLFIAINQFRLQQLYKMLHKLTKANGKHTLTCIYLRLSFH